MNQYFSNYNSAMYEALAATSVCDRTGAELDPDAGIDRMCELSAECRDKGSAQYICGNGASAAFASHMSIDWSKNAGVRTLAFNDPALLTAVANDVGADALFSKGLAYYGKPSDILVTVSSSGNSPNIFNAIEKARELSMHVVTLSGLRSNNKSRELGDLNFYVPAKTYGVAECAHQIILHMWFDRFLGVAEWSRETEQDMREDSYQL